MEVGKNKHPKLKDKGGYMLKDEILEIIKKHENFNLNQFPVNDGSNNDVVRSCFIRNGISKIDFIYLLHNIPHPIATLELKESRAFIVLNPIAGEIGFIGLSSEEGNIINKEISDQAREELDMLFREGLKKAASRISFLNIKE